MLHVASLCEYLCSHPATRLAVFLHPAFSHEQMHGRAWSEINQRGFTEPDLGFQHVCQDADTILFTQGKKQTQSDAGANWMTWMNKTSADPVHSLNCHSLSSEEG